jgi:hypothetical protein
VKDGAAVDEYVYQKELYHVLNHNGKIYDCMMNQTNIMGGNNNNKFYVVQVLETDASPSIIILYIILITLKVNTSTSADGEESECRANSRIYLLRPLKSP